MTKRNGLVLINTGTGKGKTTAAFGLALRALGQGFNVLILQFLKGRANIGEITALTRTGLPVEIKQFGRDVFFKSRTCEPIDVYLATRGLASFRKAMASGRYDLIVLDEIIMAIDFGLLQLQDVKKAIAQKPPELHLILTGRNAPAGLIEVADLVTEMREIKHPFSQGVAAQKGIEY
jgi:cob(I)alamin adenosyltransferase